MSSIQSFYEEAEKEGFGWQRTNGYTFGVQVTDVQRWAVYMVKVYERRFGRTLEGKVFSNFPMTLEYIGIELNSRYCNSFEFFFNIKNSS
jgi:hypothetical protein